MLPPTMLIETVRVTRPEFSLEVLLQLVTSSSCDFVVSLTRAEIARENYRTNRKVFCASFEDELEISAMADTDICCSFLAHIADQPELLAEYFEDDTRMIVDYNVLQGIRGDYHIGCEFINDSLIVRRVARLDPEKFHRYRFIKVALI